MLPFACATIVSAHHSPAAFDTSIVRDVQGTVTNVDWRNPHVYLSVETVGPDGKPLTRLIEAGPPSVLLPRGVTADSFRRGDKVTVRASPNRNGDERAMLGIELRKADGSVLPLHAMAMKSASAVNATAESVAGTWVPRPAGMAELGGKARSWSLTERGRAEVKGNRDAIAAMRAKCIPFGPPSLMTVPVVSKIEVLPREVVLTLDWMNVRRRVALDLDKHPAQLTPSVLGHSIGRWEDGTLVVDTIGYAASPEGLGFELPSSAAKHVVERFSLSTDRRRLVYDVRVEDSEILVSPVSFRTEWDYQPGQKMSGLPCDGKVSARYATED